MNSFQKFMEDVAPLLILAGIACIIGFFSDISYSNNDDISKDAQTNSWHCVDVTSYNQNAFDDNKCTNGSEVRYVSDSQAESLDSNYSAGRSGHPYYNSK